MCLKAHQHTHDTVALASRDKCFALLYKIQKSETIKRTRRTMLVIFETLAFYDVTEWNHERARKLPM